MKLPCYLQGPSELAVVTCCTHSIMHGGVFRNSAVGGQNGGLGLESAKPCLVIAWGLSSKAENERVKRVLHVLMQTFVYFIMCVGQVLA